MNAIVSPFPTDLSPEALHGRYSAKIERLIRRVLGSDVEHEDVRQDVFMTVLRKAHTLRNPESMDYWVTQVTINTLKYMMRRRRLRRHSSWETVPDGLVPTFHADFESRELATRALRVLDRLPRSDRTLLFSYWLGSETANEIAARTGWSTITVRRRISKARCRFERLARRDPALARCLDDAATWSRRWRPHHPHASA